MRWLKSPHFWLGFRYGYIAIHIAVGGAFIGYFVTKLILGF